MIATLHTQILALEDGQNAVPAAVPALATEGMANLVS
jgi:hypothetical protein